MVYTYTPAYYSTLHDSITSICKTILPFSFKKKRLTSAEHRLSKLQSDNLKWQQDSFHQILNLMGLHKEGILAENEVSAFKTHLLETLIASPLEHEQAVILRDKLVFLQDLLYAKCISEDEYHSSKRPLLQRLAVQGAEIESRDVIVAGPKDTKEKIEEEWSVIDLKDEKSLIGKETLQSINRSKPNSAMKQIKGAASVFGFGSAHKLSKHKEEKSIFEVEARLPSSGHVSNERENPLWDSQLKDKESETKSILMQASLPNESVKESASNDKPKRKPFKTLFQQEQREGDGGGGGGANGFNCEEKTSKSAKKPWGFDGFKKWKKNDSDGETAPLPLNNERSDSEAYSGSCNLVNSPVGEGPDTKQIKKKLHSNGSSSDFFIDKVLGDKIKKELSKIQTELCTTNPSLKFSDDQIEAISTKLPVDKADLKKFFPKSWCDRYGDVVLDVVKKEFKDHVGEMENMRNAAREKHHNNSMRWTTFEDEDENCHPNLFSQQDHSFPKKQQNFTANNDQSAYTNPFSHDYSESNGIKLRTESFQNPFWIPRQQY
ncbi:hypothetical protein POTOM_057529 [Populus tomentosa]|uniref:Uncharacterized protein n=1 Tax=Populus tomentosa TaxID=118781 RepID=A0A8X8BXP6_POPTO|nr:hypothetical protein POTOM_057529 [Populus tomentosa]